MLIPFTLDLLIDEAQELGHKPRFHGNGFAQLYLPVPEGEEWPGLRLHVWHPDLLPTRVIEGNVHDHRFDLDSEIYLGQLRHTSFDITFSETGKNRLYSVVPAHESGKFEAGGGEAKRDEMKPVPGTRCDLTLRDDFILSEGSRYFFSRRRFHATTASGLTMTVMTKVYEEADEARVVGPHDGFPDHAFLAPAPSEQTLWEVIGEARTIYRRRAQ